MTHHFHIATLPRCRSAWLANLLNGPDTLCHHEIMRTRWVGGPDDELFIPWSNEAPAEGACGTDLALWHELSGFPLVLVTRSEEAIRSSLHRTFGQLPEPHRVLDLALEGIEQLRGKAQLEVDADSLDRWEVVREVFLVLGIAPPRPARLEIMLGLNVQTDYNSMAGGYRATESFRNIFGKISSR